MLTFDRFRRAVEQHLELDLTGVRPETALADASLDSLTLFEVWLVVDQLSQGQVVDDALASCTTWGDLFHWCCLAVDAEAPSG